MFKVISDAQKLQAASDAQKLKDLTEENAILEKTIEQLFVRFQRLQDEVNAMKPGTRAFNQSIGNKVQDAVHQRCQKLKEGFQPDLEEQIKTLRQKYSKEILEEIIKYYQECIVEYAKSKEGAPSIGSQLITWTIAIAKPTCSLICKVVSNFISMTYHIIKLILSSVKTFLFGSKWRAIITTLTLLLIILLVSGTVSPSFVLSSLLKAKGMASKYLPIAFDKGSALLSITKKAASKYLPIAFDKGSALLLFCFNAIKGAAAAPGISDAEIINSLVTC